MAKLHEILPRRWPGNDFRIDDTAGTLAAQYTKLAWLSANPKPSLAEVEAQEASVDAELVVEAEDRRRDRALDRLHTLIKILRAQDQAIMALRAIANRPNGHPDFAQYDALRARIQEIIGGAD